MRTVPRCSRCSTAASCAARTRPAVTGLEREWAEYLGVAHCLATNSGTAALHTAIAALGISPGAEVIVPAYTYIATAAAVAHHGAVPVFCDIDERTFNIDPARIEERVTERTAAIMPVHLHGLPADMEAIQAVADRHGLAVIEDAAQAHGATYKGKRAGALADCAGFSLNQTKNLAAGEGGLFVTDDPELFAVARRFSNRGEPVPNIGPGEFRIKSYVSHGLGWNYRLQELPAAVARSQLRRLDAYTQNAQRNAAILNEGLSAMTGLTTPYVPADRTSVFYKYRLGFDREALGADVEASRASRPPDPGTSGRGGRGAAVADRAAPRLSGVPARGVRTLVPGSGLRAAAPVGPGGVPGRVASP